MAGRATIVISMLVDRAALARSSKVVSRDLAIWADLTDLVCGCLVSCYSVTPSGLCAFTSKTSLELVNFVFLLTNVSIESTMLRIS